MSNFDFMQFYLRTPAEQVFGGAVVHLYAVAESGAFGLLPRHRDLLTALQPSVLVARDAQQQELFFAVDEGVLVKRGQRVEVAVRRAVQGADLDGLQARLAEVFSALDEQEREARSALSRLESSAVRRFAELGKPL